MRKWQSAEQACRAAAETRAGGSRKPLIARNSGSEKCGRSAHRRTTFRLEQVTWRIQMNLDRHRRRLGARGRLGQGDRDPHGDGYTAGKLHHRAAVVECGRSAVMQVLVQGRARGEYAQGKDQSSRSRRHQATQQADQRGLAAGTHDARLSPETCAGQGRYRSAPGSSRRSSGPAPPRKIHLLRIGAALTVAGRPVPAGLRPLPPAGPPPSPCPVRLVFCPTLPIA
jgi:hypothetical protein